MGNKWSCRGQIKNRKQADQPPSEPVNSVAGEAKYVRSAVPGGGGECSLLFYCVQKLAVCRVRSVRSVRGPTPVPELLILVDP